MDEKQKRIAFAKKNLKECVQELINFHKTGELKYEGKMEQLCKMYDAWDDSFECAQDIIIVIALEKIVNLLP